MATELKFAVLFQAVDAMSDKLSSIGGGIRNLAERATQGAERISQLGERLVNFGEKVSLVTALVSEGASTMHEWTDALSEPAMAMEKSFATMSAMTNLSTEALSEVREHAVAFSNTHPGTTAEQWADGFTRMREVYQDTATAMKAEDIAAMLTRFGVDTDSMTAMLGATQANMGASAQTTGDQFLRMTQLFGINKTDTSRFAVAIGKLGGLAKATNTPMAELMSLTGAANKAFGGGRGMGTFASMLAELVSSGKSGVNWTHGLTAGLAELQSKLAGMSGVEQIAELKELGAGETNAPQMQGYLRQLAEARAGTAEIAKAGGTTQKTFTKATKDAADQITQLHQNWANFADAVYTPALPFVVKWTQLLGGATKNASGLAEKHSAIMRDGAIAMTIGGVGIYHGVQAMSALGLASIGLGQGMKEIRKLSAAGPMFRSLASNVTSIASTMYEAIPAITSFDFAMLLNPLVWIPAAVIAVAALSFAIYEYWGPISAFAERLWGDIKGIFTGAAAWMESAGMNLMRELGHGILAGIEYPFHAAEHIASGIKNFFVGHSPPPMGPLHELGRITIAETIASHIRPAPILGAITRTAAAVAIAAPMMATPAAAAFGSGSTSAAIAGSTSAAPIVHYAPVINGSGLSEAALLRTLEAHAYELRRILNREDERRERTELK